MSKTEIIVLSLLIVAIVAIAISALCYVKNKQRYISPFSQNSKYLSNKTIDVFFNEGYYFSFNNLVFKLVFTLVGLLVINTVLTFSVLQNWFSSQINTNLYIVCSALFSLLLVLGIRYDYANYKKFKNKLNDISVNEQEFKTFVNSLSQYKVNSKLLSNKLSKISNKKYMNDNQCKNDVLSLLNSLIVFTNYKRQFFLDSSNEEQKQEFIKTINTFYLNVCK